MMSQYKTNPVKPLVSIVIITYNSACFIEETLESAKKQTYDNIELIISDDCSTDSTLEICKKWIDENNNYFESCKLVISPVNRGIPANCNRGIEASKGDWIKLLAGDDLFHPDCISDNVDYINRNNDVKFLFSNIDYLIENKSLQYAKDIPLIDLEFFNSKPIVQHKLLVYGGVFVPTTTAFLNKNALNKLGLFDEEIILCEDYPMWIKATYNGIKLHYMDKKTIKYRLHSDSVMAARSLRYEKSMQKVFFKYRFKFLISSNPLLAFDLLIRNLSRTNRFWSKITPYILPYSYIPFRKRN